MKSDLQNTKLKKGKLKGYSGGRKCETFVEEKNILSDSCKLSLNTVSCPSLKIKVD